MLMAELEEKEHGDEGRAREWMTRAVRAKRDPAWTADGHVSDRWMPVSPVTGRLDAFQWKDPVADLHPHETVIELHELPPVDPSAPPPKPVATQPAITVPTTPAVRTFARPATAAAPVVPLVHVPDDPGPDPQPLEPNAGRSPEPPSDGWRKLRGLFK
jgi:HemY protein